MRRCRFLPGEGGAVLHPVFRGRSQKLAPAVDAPLTVSPFSGRYSPLVEALGGAQRGQKSPAVRRDVWDTVGWPWEEQEPAPGAARALLGEVFSLGVPGIAARDPPHIRLLSGSVDIKDIWTDGSYLGKQVQFDVGRGTGVAGRDAQGTITTLAARAAAAAHQGSSNNRKISFASASSWRSSAAWAGSASWIFARRCSRSLM